MSVKQVCWDSWVERRHSVLAGRRSSSRDPNVDPGTHTHLLTDLGHLHHIKPSPVLLSLSPDWHNVIVEMMVIKEEKNWSPILDMDMVKHMVSSSQLYLVALSSLLARPSSWNSKKQFPLHLFVLLTKQRWLHLITLTLALKFRRDNLIWQFQFQAIYTKSKIRPCITFDAAKKQSTRNCPYFVFYPCPLSRCQVYI